MSASHFELPIDLSAGEDEGYSGDAIGVTGDVEAVGLVAWSVEGPVNARGDVAGSLGNLGGVCVVGVQGALRALQCVVRFPFSGSTAVVGGACGGQCSGGKQNSEGTGHPHGSILEGGLRGPAWCPRDPGSPNGWTMSVCAAVELGAADYGARVLDRPGDTTDLGTLTPTPLEPLGPAPLAYDPTDKASGT